MIIVEGEVGGSNLLVLALRELLSTLGHDQRQVRECAGLPAESVPEVDLQAITI